jgi:PST family polysaccharide transporter
VQGEAAGVGSKEQSGPSSYFQILRSTILIGGSSMLAILFAIIRNKAAALLVGPEGIGLMSLYTVLLELAQGTASLGLQSSGVRQIAEAAGNGNMHRAAVTAAVLRKSSLMLGAVGMALMLALCVPITRVTFGDHARVTGVTLLAFAVLLRVLAGAQITLLQGTRQIGLLARSNVLAAAFGTVATVPLLYFWGMAGIAPSLVAVTAISLILSWYYARRLELQPVVLSSQDVRRETSALLKLGLAFLASTLLTTGVAYAVRLLVLHSHGPTAAGFYQAAWTIGGLYAGFVLQAMGADFYPRLTAICEDNEACNRLVNEQAQIGMLLAGPGLLATLSLAPLVIELFYSPQFHEAGDALRWICLGMMLRVVAWPIGFIIVAKGMQTIFVATEVIATAVHFGSAWLLTPRFGATGAAAAYFGLYAFHIVLIYFIVRRLSGFRWSAANVRLGVLLFPAAAVVFGLFLVTSFWQATLIGSLITLITSLYCLRSMMKLLPLESIPAPIRSRLLRTA